MIEGSRTLPDLSPCASPRSRHQQCSTARYHLTGVLKICWGYLLDGRKNNPAGIVEHGPPLLRRLVPQAPSHLPAGSCMAHKVQKQWREAVRNVCLNGVHCSAQGWPVDGLLTESGSMRVYMRRHVQKTSAPWLRCSGARRYQCSLMCCQPSGLLPPLTRRIMPA